MDIKLINIGFGNIVSANRVIAIVSPESAPIKRIVQEAREAGRLIDATYGRRTRAVIIMDSDHVVLSAVQPETVAHRAEDAADSDEAEAKEIKETENKDISLPQPTHSSKDERTGSHEPQFKSLEEASAHFRRPVKADVQLPAWVTVGDAFGDLPELFPSADTKYKLEKITAPKKYKCEPMNDYQRIMRNWFGSPNPFLTGNCFRKTLRDFPIFAQMKQGDNFVQASEIADNLFKEACEIRNITPANVEAFEKLKKEIVPPYNRDNFLGKWCKLSLNKPSHTLVAHLSVDTYSHIHPVEPRGISVREAARLQSFPDGFLLQCSMGDAFKQIGNAVPPLMANAVAKSIKAAFEKG